MWGDEESWNWEDAKLDLCLIVLEGMKIVYSSRHGFQYEDKEHQKCPGTEFTLNEAQLIMDGPHKYI